MFQPLKVNFFLILFFLPILAIALPEDNEQMMYIVSDTSTLNYKTGVNIFEGNVKIDQGTTHLTADRVVTQSNDHHTMESAVAYGIKQLAEYITVLKKEDPLF